MFRRLGVDAIFHAGDYVAPFAAKLIGPDVVAVPTFCIYGNNDGERAGLKKVLPNLVDGPIKVTLATPAGTCTIAMHHFIEWFEPADLVGADVVISGHDHQAAVEQRDGRMLLNPGECCGWVHDRCTVAVLDLSGGRPAAEIIEVGA